MVRRHAQQRKRAEERGLAQHGVVAVRGQSLAEGSVLGDERADEQAEDVVASGGAPVVAVPVGTRVLEVGGVVVSLGGQCAESEPSATDGVGVLATGEHGHRVAAFDQATPDRHHRRHVTVDGRARQQEVRHGTGANLARQPRTARARSASAFKQVRCVTATLPVVPAAATTFRRARSAEHTEQRARDLLEAARMLAAEQGVRTVTLTAIATRAGVHVSAVRRYFDSREDILLTLAGEGWREWAGRVAVSVQPGPSGPVGPAEALAATLAELPLFCDLLAHVPLTLEREAPVESVRAFTVIVLAAVESIAGALADVGDGLDRSRARDLPRATPRPAGSPWQARA